MSVVKLLKKILKPKQIKMLRNIRREYYFNFVTRLHPDNLMRLAKDCGTDKIGGHSYAKIYSEIFHKLRFKKLKILEIGVGGDEDPDSGGGSLRMWMRYFPKSMIYSIDIYNKSRLQKNRIKIFQGNQADETFLKSVGSQIGPLDIIIDDGSHIASHVITSFKALFPFLKEGGIYAIEDIQTSYWPDYGGNSENLNDPSTSMNFFKSLADNLNYCEFLRADYSPTYFDKNIKAVHFFHNLVLIYKGQNNEHSNMVENGKFK